MLDKILNDDWSRYDNRKIKDKRDRLRFSCEEPWEVDHLVKIIAKHYPQRTREQILEAIKDVCAKSNQSRMREVFVDLVINNLNY